jgi:hypothetical protein
MFSADPTIDPSDSAGLGVILRPNHFSDVHCGFFASRPYFNPK